MMRTTLSLCAAAFALAAAAPAFASDNAGCGNAPRDQWLTEDAVKATLAAQNYDVRSMKVEDGCYEAYAIDKTGARVEVYLNPVSGAVVETKVDD
jgi:hypothetical protein